VRNKFSSEKQRKQKYVALHGCAPSMQSPGWLKNIIKFHFLLSVGKHYIFFTGIRGSARHAHANMIKISERKVRSCSAFSQWDDCRAHTHTSSLAAHSSLAPYPAARYTLINTKSPNRSPGITLIWD